MDGARAIPALHDTPQEQLAAMIEAHCRKVFALTCDLGAEMTSFARDLLTFADLCPEAGPLAEFLGAYALRAGGEIAAVVERLAAPVLPRIGTDRGADGPGRLE